MAWRLDVVPGSVPGSQAVGDPAPSGASTILAEAPVIIRQKLTNVFTIPNDRQKVNIFPGGRAAKPRKNTVYIPCKIFYK